MAKLPTQPRYRGGIARRDRRFGLLARGAQQDVASRVHQIDDAGFRWGRVAGDGGAVGSCWHGKITKRTEIELGFGFNATELSMSPLATPPASAQPATPSLRPPIAAFTETEVVGFDADHNPRLTKSLTILMRSQTCRLACKMCDLASTTHREPTALGALPHQIRLAMGQHMTGPGRLPATLKLYNAGNFFDPTATPPGDEQAIITLCEPFDRIVVENHPRIGVRRMMRFAEKLGPERLEVAVGVESLAPGILKRLDKQFTRDQVDAFAERLSQRGVRWRVFLIHGLPGQSIAERAAWTHHSVRHVARWGAKHVSIIPLRNAPRAAAAMRKPVPALVSVAELTRLQQKLLCDPRLVGRCVVTLDTWGLHGIVDPNLSPIQRMNLTQSPDC